MMTPTDAKNYVTQGPDNSDPNRAGSHMTMVTGDHLNHLFKLILKLIRANVGDEKADWLINIAVYAQQVTFFYLTSLDLSHQTSPTCFMYSDHHQYCGGASSRSDLTFGGEVPPASGGHVPQGGVMQGLFEGCS